MPKKEIVKNDALTVRVSADPILDVIEKSLDEIEDKLGVVEEGYETVVEVAKTNPVIVGAAVVVGLAVGGFIGYKIAIKRLTLRYEEMLTDEIANAKEFYARVNKEGDFSTPEGAAAVLIPEEVVSSVKGYQGKREHVAYDRPKDIPVPVVEEAEVVSETSRNIFTEAAEATAWDIDLEIANRESHPDTPYVVSFEEFDENSEAHDQSSLTYYVGDQTLCDEKDKPIDTVEYTVGEDNLLRFGHGSRDPNVVYVRNERLQTDFEITRSYGSFAQEVLGLDPTPDRTLRHSHERRNTRQMQRGAGE